MFSRTANHWFRKFIDFNAEAQRTLRTAEDLEICLKMRSLKENNVELPVLTTHGFAVSETRIGRDRKPNLKSTVDSPRVWGETGCVVTTTGFHNLEFWRVTYGCVSAGATTKSKPKDLKSIATRLANALREIRSFSKSHGCGGFAQCFTGALDSLDTAGKSLHGYHEDLVPTGHLSDEARTILAACQKAWVFGGMGSWNDMGFDGEDQEEYERVSEQLFHTVNEAICEAANQSYYRFEQGPEGAAVDHVP